MCRLSHAELRTRGPTCTRALLAVVRCLPDHAEATRAQLTAALDSVVGRSLFSPGTRPDTQEQETAMEPEKMDKIEKGKEGEAPEAEDVVMAESAEKDEQHNLARLSQPVGGPVQVPEPQEQALVSGFVDSFPEKRLEL